MNTIDEWVARAGRYEHEYTGHGRVLAEAAAGAAHVTELGGRRPVSTVLLLATRPASYLLVDPNPGMELGDLARVSAPHTRVAHAAVRSERLGPDEWRGVCDGPEGRTDVLLIDTAHNGTQLAGELALYAPRTRRRIVLHATTTHGRHGEGGNEGMVTAIRALVEGRLGPPAGEWFVMRHEAAGYGMTVLSRDPADRPARPVRMWAPAGGPGTELKGILSGLGVNPGPTCDCNAKSAQMDLWGVAGCRANFQTILGWLRDGAPKWGWADRLRAAANAVASGLAFKLNPLDPFPGVLEEAIRRAEAWEARTASEPAGKGGAL